VTRQGVVWIAIGLSVGLAASVAFAQLLGGLLYGVTPADPLVLTGATVVLGATAYLSCLVPAQLTSRLNPMTVLREQ
jgi:ABC-type antimicrobial peptide transport system permease subunit